MSLMPNKSVEPTRVIAVRVIRARQVAGGSPLIVRPLGGRLGFHGEYFSGHESLVEV